MGRKIGWSLLCCAGAVLLSSGWSSADSSQAFAGVFLWLGAGCIAWNERNA